MLNAGLGSLRCCIKTTLLNTLDFVLDAVIPFFATLDYAGGFWHLIFKNKI